MFYVLVPNVGVLGQAYGTFVCFQKAKEFAVNNGLVGTHIPIRLTIPKQEK